MNDFLKKSFLIGLGATIASKEKAEKFLNDLSKSGGAAADEAKSLLESFNEKGKENTDKWRTELHQDVVDAIKDLGFVTQEEYANLKEKLTLLENELTGLKQTVSKRDSSED
ncbi:hypothetical protein NIE88_07785 [Sporolactobacillus shoreicorticis]|uniref:Phasin family protein n=1 Tax=Sporolactobacillus shoreicorticis TaxID=1923877 RepID=A0ABW5S5U5_9BACL|nr:hypothetical protein [Sporolactobacillus shoreicorticis]MCO7125668.1 hypothetical protein [Sporolactobacillus shoreicorticis]